MIVSSELLGLVLIMCDDDEQYELLALVLDGEQCDRCNESRAPQAETKRTKDAVLCLWQASAQFPAH